MSEVSKFYKIAKKELFKLNRSITGDGLKRTLKIYKKNFPELKIKSIKSGKKVFDWKVPPEWKIKNAYILDKNHKMIVNFKENNLHLVGYSKPLNKRIKKKELFKKLHSLKNQPSAIPYVTSYYKKDWGFCISHNKKKKLDKLYKHNDEFKVLIDSSFNKKGKLNYGELVIKGKSKEEILISTYICHPSMANNELSGSIVSLSLIDYFKKKKINKSLRFIFIPETIGSIVYIYRNLNKLKNNFIGGYNLSCIGDEKNYSCILSKYENTHVDYSLIKAFKNLGIKYKKFSFLKRGSDERQFNHPGVDFPMATICRSKFFEYPEYHTSLDNFDLVTEKGLAGGYKVAKEAITILMKKIIPKSITICEPNMGKRGLYNKLSIKTNYGNKNPTKNFLSFLQYSDGKNDLNQISKYLNLKVSEVEKIYLILKKKKLVR